jgi:hypothetical protein
LLARTSPSETMWDLLLALHASASILCNLPSCRKKPFFRTFTWQGTGNGERNHSLRFTHSLRLQPDLTASRPGATAVGCDRHPGRDASLQTDVSVECHFSCISPAFPRSLASVLIPRPAAQRVSASHCVRPPGFGFQKIFVQRTQKDFSNLPKKTPLGLGSGAHSRRFAQECPEGNPGKYKQGETPWHSTKTKSP